MIRAAGPLQGGPAVHAVGVFRRARTRPPHVWRLREPPPAPEKTLEANLEAMQEAVSAKVPDTQRAARLNKSIVDLGQQLLSFRALRDRFQSDLLTLNARPDVTRTELEARIGQFDKERVAIRARVFELPSELIAATPEEWKGLPVGSTNRRSARKL